MPANMDPTYDCLPDFITAPTAVFCRFVTIGVHRYLPQYGMRPLSIVSVSNFRSVFVSKPLEHHMRKQLAVDLIEIKDNFVTSSSFNRPFLRRRSAFLNPFYEFSHMYRAFAHVHPLEALSKPKRDAYSQGTPALLSQGNAVEQQFNVVDGFRVR